MQTVIGYSFRIKKTKIDYKRLRDMLDDVVALFLADYKGNVTSIMTINDVKESDEKKSKAYLQAKKSTAYQFAQSKNGKVSLYLTEDNDNVIGVQINGIERLKSKAEKEYQIELARWRDERLLQQHLNFDERYRD